MAGPGGPRIGNLVRNVRAFSLFDNLAYCKLCLGKERSRRVFGLVDKRFRLFDPSQVEVFIKDF